LSPIAGNKEDLERIAESMEGQLTAAIQGTVEDLKEHARLIRILERKVGRIIFNGYGTGIEVCPSMHHGGPYPATTHSFLHQHRHCGDLPLCASSLLSRLSRRVLPAALQNKNVTGAWRMVDGESTKADA